MCLILYFGWKGEGKDTDSHSRTMWACLHMETESIGVTWTSLETECHDVAGAAVEVVAAVVYRGEPLDRLPHRNP